MVLGRPRVAELIEAQLAISPGVLSAHANPVTGRVLVRHDTSLTSDDIEPLIREATASAVTSPAPTTTAVRSSGAEPPPQRQPVSPMATVVRWVGGALAFVRVFHPPSIVRLGAVFVATAVVVRRAWRRHARHSDTAPRELGRHPLLQIVGPHRRRLYLAACVSVVVQILEMLPAFFIGWMALVLITGESSALVSLGLATSSSQLLFLVGAVALAFAVLSAVSHAGTMLWDDLAQSVTYEWRTQTYAHVQRAELGHLEGERTTRVASALTDDVAQLGRFFAGSADYFVQLGSGLVILVPAFLAFAPGIAWIAFLPVPVIAWLSFRHQERMAPKYAASGEDESLLNSQVTTNLEASATVKSFGAEDFEIERIDRLSLASRLSSRPIAVGTSAYAQTVRVSVMGSLAGLLYCGGLEVLNGALPFQVFSPLVGLPQIVLWKLPRLANAVDDYQRTTGALERLIDIRRLPVEATDAGEPLDVTNVNGEIVLENVTFSYPGRPPVFDGMSLYIAPKRTTGIVGVTGAGKTTIAKLLMRFHDVQSGRVLLDGQDVRAVRLHDLRAAIAFVGQDPFLFDGTVEDNIRYGSFGADREKIAEAAALAAVSTFIEGLPSKYETGIGERGATLSGGQRQRLSLSRALLKDAPILILDEATSAVDNETEAAIQDALARFATGRTLVIIAHRLSTIRHADWIYVMGDDGAVVEAGSHEELLDRAGVYAALWALQIGEARQT